MVREGEVTDSYRAAVASAVACTQAFTANPSQAQVQIAARSLQDALSQGLFLSGVPKENVAKLASSIVANRGSEVLSAKSLRPLLPAPLFPTPRSFNSLASRHMEPDIVTQLRVEYALDSCGDRLTNYPGLFGARDREGK